MATNHSLSVIEESGEIVGDPMEVKLFEFGEFQVSNENHHHESILFSF